jgi:hypothetical protein
MRSDSGGSRHAQKGQGKSGIRRNLWRRTFRLMAALAISLTSAGVLLVFLSSSDESAQALPIGGEECSNGSRYKLVFEEQFNQSNLAQLEENWDIFDNSPGHAGYGRREREAVSVGDGVLNIKAGMRNGVLQSGGLEMKSHFGKTYGKYVVRLRADADPSNATNAVALTWPLSGNQPRDGENNIFETYDHRDTRSPVDSYIHMPGFGNDGSKQEQIRHNNINGQNWVTSEMEWSPSRMIFTQYDHETRAYSKLQNQRSEVIPHNPHTLHLQLDAFKQSMGNDVNMQVAYAAFYTYEGSC